MLLAYDSGIYQLHMPRSAFQDALTQEVIVATQVRELAALERLHGEFGFTYEDLARALGTNESTLHRWRRGGEPTTVYLKRLAAFESFLEELDALFDTQGTREWLDRRLEVLKNRTPREMILDGHVDRVTGVLYAMNAGAAL